MMKHSALGYVNNWLVLNPHPHPIEAVWVHQASLQNRVAVARQAIRDVEQRLGKAGALEVVTFESTAVARRADLMFIHGAWSSSWYWETFFLPWFAERGYRCTAVSLRGHGNSEGKVRWASINDYVSDVAVAAQRLDNPIVIGHSMGGFVAQKFAAKHQTRGVALIASVPPSGAWHTLHRVVTERPLAFLRTLATLDLYGVVADHDTARGLLFSRDESRTNKDHLLRYLKSESFRAFLDMLFAPIRKPISQDIPVTVIGAEFDQSISHKNVIETARKHNAEAIMLPLTSHMLMVDDRWQDAAVLLESWITRAVLKETMAHKPKPNGGTPKEAVTQVRDHLYPPKVKKRAKMLGRMQYQPLILSSILEYVEISHPEIVVWSREAPAAIGKTGAIHRQTWGDTAQRARQLAAILLEFGIEEGNRVASIAWNTHRHLELYYGVTGIGAILHTINPRLSLAHLEFMINEAEDKVVFYDGTFSGLVAMLKPLCPSVCHWVQLSEAPNDPKWSDQVYDTQIAKVEPLANFPELDEHGAAVLCYTSGTTGMPKGVLYSHRSLVLEAMSAISPDMLSLSRDDTVAPISSDVPCQCIDCWCFSGSAGFKYGWRRSL